MQKYILSVLLLSSSLCFSASESQNIASSSADSCGVSLYLSSLISCTKTRLFGGIVLGGAALFGLYKLVSNMIYQEEERVFEEHRSVELEPYAVSKKDYGMICDLIDAMEQDIQQFSEQPLRVKGLELVEFDNEEMANGCKGMRDVFCTLYEQCVLEPENKPFLKEVVVIFKQTVEEGMVVA